MFVLAVRIGHHQSKQPIAAVSLCRYIGDLGCKYTLNASQFFKNHVCSAMRDTAHRSAARWHAVAHQLHMFEHVKQLELHAVGIVTGLCDTADDDGLNAENRPVVEIDLDPGRRQLQHVVSGNGRETPAP